MIWSVHMKQFIVIYCIEIYVGSLKYFHRTRLNFVSRSIDNELQWISVLHCTWQESVYDKSAMYRRLNARRCRYSMFLSFFPVLMLINDTWSINSSSFPKIFHWTFFASDELNCNAIIRSDIFRLSEIVYSNVMQ